LKEEQKQLSGDHFESAIKRLEEELAERRNQRRKALDGQKESPQKIDDRQVEDQRQEFEKLAEQGEKVRKQNEIKESCRLASILIGAIVGGLD
jgi:hypothetical protein